METNRSGTRNTRRRLYGNEENDFRLRGRNPRCCRYLGWEYGREPADLSLLRPCDGNWDASRFLVVPPGQHIEPSYDADIIIAGN
jgi:hypothetical protein